MQNRDRPRGPTGAGLPQWPTATGLLFGVARVREAGYKDGMVALPHEGVWCRLGVSGIHGVGVFAAQPIPAGTSVFANDDGAIVWIEAAELDMLPPTSPVRPLYHDFAIHRGTQLGCPANFNLLTVGWYVNEPLPGAAPNLVVAADYAMVTARPIEEGEELTVDYRTFSWPMAATTRGSTPPAS